MGINIHAAEFLLHAKELGVELGSTLTIGRQDFVIRKRGKWPWSRFRNISVETLKLMKNSVQPDQKADLFFKNLGASKVSSIDNSDYEQADFVHDLNQPITASLRKKFDTVFDGGSLEHIFNVPMALANMMQIVKVGGHFLSMTVADSFCGHGFYQFSPEFFFRTLNSDNGFECKFVGLMDKERLPKLVKLHDPVETGERLEYALPNATYILAVAKRISDVVPFKNWPQQSTYSNSWNSNLAPPVPRVIQKLV